MKTNESFFFWLWTTSPVFLLMRKAGLTDIMNSFFPLRLSIKTIHLLHVPMHPLPLLNTSKTRQKVQYHHVQSNLPKRQFYRIIMTPICLHNQGVNNSLAVAIQYHIEYADTEVPLSPAF